MADTPQKIWDAAAASLRDSTAVTDAASAVRGKLHPGPPRPQLDQQQWYDQAIAQIQQAAAGGFPGFAREHLKILDKSGNQLPLILNRAQRYVHDMAEAQLARRGYVRIIVLKGRQMGVSTMILGRGYFKTTRKRGQKAYILSHEVKSTEHLFNDIVKYYHEHVDRRFRPHVAKSNDTRLEFDRMNGGYVVGTAKSGDTGRSITAQFFHGSEVAFWPQSSDIAAGVMQAIGTVEGTEIWLESTGNGIGNYFHVMVQLARKGENDFEVAFCPWYWAPEYETRADLIPDDFEQELTVDDQQYQEIHGLSRGQMYWRHRKIGEFMASEDGTREGGQLKFQQEYPATIEEAFLGDNANAFIRAQPIILARRAWREEHERTGARPVGRGQKILGLDPSYTGPDKFSIWARQGRVAYWCASWQKQKNQVSLGRCLIVFEREHPDIVFMDVGNTGGPLYDDLCETKWGNIIVPVLFGDPADEPERYYNKRAEMWARGRGWLIENPQTMLEDRDDIQADLTSVQTARNAKPNQVKLESKDDMRKRGLPSPDDGDAFCLTFAYDADATVGRNAPDPHRRVTYGSGLSIPGRG